MLSSDEDTRFTPKNPYQSAPPIRTHRTPVYIPTIPRYIDAFLSRHPFLASLPDAPRYAGHSSIEISYLIRYLFLEDEAQREKLLPTLAKCDDVYFGSVQEDGEKEYYIEEF